MSAIVEAPRDLMESLAEMRFPPKADARLRQLMDQNTEGRLTPTERDELEALAELSETMALYRARALRLLGRSPT